MLWLAYSMMIALVACAAPQPTAVQSPATLSLNDVSVLFPADAAVWPASMPGKDGPLLAEASFAQIRLSLVREVEVSDQYAALRVVAVRFDPCFRRALHGPCEVQVRLVLQVPDAAGGFFDGAVHALYRLDVPAARLGCELRAVAALGPENAAVREVGVSPALSLQGSEGAYGQALRALVARYAGPSSLVRVTFMTRTPSRSGQWQFGGLEGGAKLKIAGLVPDATQQNVTRSVGHDYEYTVMPRFGEAVARPGASAGGLRQMDAGARADVHAWALRQEDPAQHLPDTTDCASCHVSGHVARHLEGLDPTLLTETLVASRVGRVTNVGELSHDNLRAFGWFGMYPVVSQRAANETGAVVAAFRALAGAIDAECTFGL